LKRYTFASDSRVIKSLATTVAKMAPSKSAAPQALPYSECLKTELFNKLRKVQQYRNAQFELAEIAVTEDIHVLQHWVKEYKLIQIRQHVESLKSAECLLFEPQKILLSDGSYTIVTPPVLERVGDTLIVIEGNTRLFHCLATGVKNVKAVIVNNVTAPLPTAPFSIGRIKLTSSTKTLEANFSQIDKSLFRKIEEAVHSP